MKASTSLYFTFISSFFELKPFHNRQGPSPSFTFLGITTRTMLQAVAGTKDSSNPRFGDENYVKKTERQRKEEQKEKQKIALERHPSWTEIGPIPGQVPDNDDKEERKVKKRVPNERRSITKSLRLQMEKVREDRGDGRRLAMVVSHPDQHYFTPHPKHDINTSKIHRKNQSENRGNLLLHVENTARRRSMAKTLKKTMNFTRTLRRSPTWLW